MKVRIKHPVLYFTVIAVIVLIGIVFSPLFPLVAGAVILLELFGAFVEKAAAGKRYEITISALLPRVIPPPLPTSNELIKGGVANLLFRLLLVGSGLLVVRLFPTIGSKEWVVMLPALIVGFIVLALEDGPASRVMLGIFKKRWSRLVAQRALEISSAVIWMVLAVVALLTLPQSEVIIPLLVAAISIIHLLQWRKIEKRIKVGRTPAREIRATLRRANTFLYTLPLALSHWTVREVKQNFDIDLFNRIVVVEAKDENSGVGRAHKVNVLNMHSVLVRDDDTLISRIAPDQVVRVVWGDGNTFSDVEDECLRYPTEPIALVTGEGRLVCLVNSVSLKYVQNVLIREREGG
jgi:hypothetical protein